MIIRTLIPSSFLSSWVLPVLQREKIFYTRSIFLGKTVRFEPAISLTAAVDNLTYILFATPV